jgi:hypothetical protein
MVGLVNISLVKVVAGLTQPSHASECQRSRLRRGVATAEVAANATVATVWKSSVVAVVGDGVGGGESRGGLEGVVADERELRVDFRRLLYTFTRRLAVRLTRISRPCTPLGPRSSQIRIQVGNHAEQRNKNTEEERTINVP